MLVQCSFGKDLGIQIEEIEQCRNVFNDEVFILNTETQKKLGDESSLRDDLIYSSLMELEKSQLLVIAEQKRVAVELEDQRLTQQDSLTPINTAIAELLRLFSASPSGLVKALESRMSSASTICWFPLTHVLKQGSF